MNFLYKTSIDLTATDIYHFQKECQNMLVNRDFKTFVKIHSAVLKVTDVFSEGSLIYLTYRV